MWTTISTKFLAKSSINDSKTHFSKNSERYDTLGNSYMNDKQLNSNQTFNKCENTNPNQLNYPISSIKNEDLILNDQLKQAQEIKTLTMQLANSFNQVNEMQELFNMEKQIMQDKYAQKIKKLKKEEDAILDQKNEIIQKEKELLIRQKLVEDLEKNAQDKQYIDELRQTIQTLQIYNKNLNEQVQNLQIQLLIEKENKVIMPAKNIDKITDDRTILNWKDYIEIKGESALEHLKTFCKTFYEENNTLKKRLNHIKKRLSGFLQEQKSLILSIKQYQAELKAYWIMTLNQSLKYQTDYIEKFWKDNSNKLVEQQIELEYSKLTEKNLNQIIEMNKLETKQIIQINESQIEELNYKIKHLEKIVQNYEKTQSESFEQKSPELFKQKYPEYEDKQYPEIIFHEASCSIGGIPLEGFVLKSPSGLSHNSSKLEDLNEQYNNNHPQENQPNFLSDNEDEEIKLAIPQYMFIQTRCATNRDQIESDSTKCKSLQYIQEKEMQSPRTRSMTDTESNNVSMDNGPLIRLKIDEKGKSLEINHTESLAINTNENMDLFTSINRLDIENILSPKITQLANNLFSNSVDITPELSRFGHKFPKRVDFKVNEGKIRQLLSPEMHSGLKSSSSSSSKIKVYPCEQDGFSDSSEKYSSISMPNNDRDDDEYYLSPRKIDEEITNTQNLLSFKRDNDNNDIDKFDSFIINSSSSRGQFQAKSLTIEYPQQDISFSTHDISKSKELTLNQNINDNSYVNPLLSPQTIESTVLPPIFRLSQKKLTDRNNNNNKSDNQHIEKNQKLDLENVVVSLKIPLHSIEPGIDPNIQMETPYQSLNSIKLKDQTPKEILFIEENLKNEKLSSLATSNGLNQVFHDHLEDNLSTRCFTQNSLDLRTSTHFENLVNKSSENKNIDTVLSEQEFISTK